MDERLAFFVSLGIVAVGAMICRGIIDWIRWAMRRYSRKKYQPVHSRPYPTSHVASYHYAIDADTLADLFGGEYRLVESARNASEWPEQVDAWIEEDYHRPFLTRDELIAMGDIVVQTPLDVDAWMHNA